MWNILLDLYYFVIDHQSTFMQKCSGKGSHKSSGKSSSKGLSKGLGEGLGEGLGWGEDKGSGEMLVKGFLVKGLGES